MRLPKESLAELKQDYRSMQDMIFESEPPSFETMMERLGALELEMNSTAIR